MEEFDDEDNLIEEDPVWSLVFDSHILIIQAAVAASDDSIVRTRTYDISITLKFIFSGSFSQLVMISIIKLLVFGSLGTANRSNP